MSERFIVLGVAPVRREWFREVGKWANEAVLPMEFIKCISVDEVHARLESGRPFSALIVDASTVGLDRDLLDLANSLGCSPIVVDHGLVDRNWAELGARAVLPDRFDAADLRGILDEHALAIHQATTVRNRAEDDETASRSNGRVVAVTGAGGMGTSTIAMGLAQGLARQPGRAPLVLADMALRSSQAMFHDARDVVPGLLEFVESHRLGVPNHSETSATIHRYPDRGYHLLLGLRHERDWLSIPARALSASWTTLISRYDTVVCDVTGEFDGAIETGSNDIEDRNRLARMAVNQADLTVVVGVPGAWGIHHLVRTILALHEAGVSCERMLPLINHAPRQPRARAGIASAIADLTSSRIPDASDLSSPIFVAGRRNLDQILRDGEPLPKGLTDGPASAVVALLQRIPERLAAPAMDAEPVAVTPGSLGTWTDDHD